MEKLAPYEKVGALWLPAMVVSAECWRSTQILALYSKVGAQLKSLKSGQSISLQPGITSKSDKSKNCLEFGLISDCSLSALDHYPFWRSVTSPENV
jgi:hypothetical protein